MFLYPNIYNKEQDKILMLIFYDISTNLRSNKFLGFKKMSLFGLASLLYFFK